MSVKFGNYIRDDKLYSYGSYKKCYKAYNTETSDTKEVLWCEIIKSNLDKIEIEKIKNEIKVIELNHPNIIKLLDVFYLNKPIFIFEFACNNDILFCIKIGENKKYLYKWIKQILSALKYLHSHNIIHRDIKPSNIVIDNSFDVKIIDFGEATKIDIKDKTNPPMTINPHKNDKFDLSPVGTPGFIAPEINNNYDSRIDIYSLGHLIICLIIKQYSKNTPVDDILVQMDIFEIENKTELLEKEYNKYFNSDNSTELMYQHLKKYPVFLKTFIEECLINKNKRKTAEELLDLYGPILDNYI